MAANTAAVNDAFHVSLLTTSQRCATLRYLLVPSEASSQISSET